jgi:D-glycero-D-manno-heptose 1,7-bisphosphate phosphatase
VVSNQRGIALNLYREQDVEAVHQRLVEMLAAKAGRIDGFYFCPHDQAQCSCRKPGPALFEKAQSDFPGISPERSVMIGDSISDIEFGRNLGMKTIFIEGDPQNRKQGATEALRLADRHVPSLSLAVDLILG